MVPDFCYVSLGRLFSLWNTHEVVFFSPMGMLHCITKMLFSLPALVALITFNFHDFGYLMVQDYLLCWCLLWLLNCLLLINYRLFRIFVSWGSRSLLNCWTYQHWLACGGKKNTNVLSGRILPYLKSDEFSVFYLLRWKQILKKQNKLWKVRGLSCPMRWRHFCRAKEMLSTSGKK